ncbi:MAG: hypothetical protein ACI9XR_002575 [Flavobacterium sp.]
MQIKRERKHQYRILKQLLSTSHLFDIMYFN